MRDMPDSGNRAMDFSHNLSDFIGAINYYLKSGYFSPSEYEISLIYKFCNEISKMILRAKTDMKSAVNRNELYKNYCKVKHMLLCPCFINVTLFGDDEYLNLCLPECSRPFSKIFTLYNKCINSLPYKEACLKKDVLIGVLRNNSQFDICLKNCFYHIPSKRLRVPAEDISYVAIYQSKKLFGDESGIKYYAKVKSYELVKRSDITEIPKSSTEKYYRFNVSKWEKLPRTITNNGGVNVFDATSRELLFNANDIRELIIKNFAVTCNNKVN